MTDALMGDFGGDTQLAPAAQPASGETAPLSLPLVLQLGISEPSLQALPPASTGAQPAAYGTPASLLQPPEVPPSNSTLLAANPQGFLHHLQSSAQPTGAGLPGVSEVTPGPAAASAPEVLPSRVQTVPVGGGPALPSNPRVTIAPSQNPAIFQSSIIMGEQNLQWILNGATGTLQNQEQMVSPRGSRGLCGQSYVGLQDLRVFCSDLYNTVGSCNLSPHRLNPNTPPPPLFFPSHSLLL